ncbi:hypothetical protein Nepgr_021778 [Nepenthes gracilis]|uniref:Uncharacterized protein n=1 Tax=Nepenthes gracilis TaxID=150966 RepID=A0AAD3T0M7_NEPGR|nr:hypothetical protein Nepgr_021778 [Nepenthes gracilis]
MHRKDEVEAEVVCKEQLFELTAWRPCHCWMASLSSPAVARVFLEAIKGGPSALPLSFSTSSFPLSSSRTPLLSLSHSLPVLDHLFHALLTLLHAGNEG